jgi:hypothetical protein
MLMARRSVFGLVGAALILVRTAAAQRFTSPPANASVKIAGKRIAVDYYAPSMHGRKIMGNLVPWGKVWCPGANVATGLTTEAALQMGHIEGAQRYLEHLGNSGREGVDSGCEQAERAASPRLRSGRRLRSHENEHENARDRSRNLPDRSVSERREQRHAGDHLGKHRSVGFFCGTAVRLFRPSSGIRA